MTYAASRIAGASLNYECHLIGMTGSKHGVEKDAEVASVCSN